MTDALSALPAAIHAVAPHADAATWATALVPVMRSSGITTPARIAAFLGQIAVESGYFTRLSEDDYYSTAARISAVFPSRFPPGTDLTPYVDNPEALANHAYANEYGNGDEASGDGWNYRARGLIGVTFRDNYVAFAAAMHMTLADAVVFAGTPAGAAASACWFWTRNGLNALADQWELSEVTRRINPACEGLAERVALAGMAKAALSTTPVISTTNPPANPQETAGNGASTTSQEITPDTDEADLLMDKFNPAPEQS